MTELAQLNREIARLENQLAALHQRRVDILESQLREAQMQAGQLAAGASAKPKTRRGRPPASKSASKATKKKAAKKKRSGGRRKRMSSEAVTNAIVETVTAAGSAGISCKDISDKSGVNYQTVAKKLKDLKNIKKTGKLKKARYTIK